MSRNRLDELRTEHRSVKLGGNPAHRIGRAWWMFPLVAVTTIVVALAIWAAEIGNVIRKANAIRKDASQLSGEQPPESASTSAASGESKPRDSVPEEPGKISPKSPLSTSNNLLGEVVLTPRIQAKLSEIVAPGFVCEELRPQSLDESFQAETITIQWGRTAEGAPEFRGSPGLILALREMAEPIRCKPRQVALRSKKNVMHFTRGWNCIEQKSLNEDLKEHTEYCRLSTPYTGSVSSC